MRRGNVVQNTSWIASHAGRAPQFAQGAPPPWTPEKAMTQTSLIKFRVTEDEKKSLFDAAKEADQSVSSILRRAGRAVIGGRVASRSVLLDLVAVRTAANALASAAANPTIDPSQMAAIAKTTAETLREIASRHLADVR